MNKKTKSTYDEHLESLTPKQREEFERGYRDHLLSELLIALGSVVIFKLAKVKND